MHKFQSESTLYSWPELQETLNLKEAPYLQGWSFLYLTDAAVV